MPRPLRFVFADAWYHVMNRGAGAQDIFKTMSHRLEFLELLADASNLFGIKVHAYCLMDNHYHLLINTPKANLPRVMRHINGLYTQRFNRSLKRDGSLFRGRYKAIVVGKDDYLLQVSRYIHLNPTEAGLCEQPHFYEWSSYAHYIDPRNKPNWLETDKILSMISKNNREAAYARFVVAGIDSETEDFYKKINTASIFGEKAFKHGLLKKLEPHEISAANADYNRTRERPSLDKINKICADQFNIDVIKLVSPSKGIRNNPRKIGMYACHLWGEATLAEIAAVYQCQTLSNVSNAVANIKKRLLTDKSLISIIDNVKNLILELDDSPM